MSETVCTIGRRKTSVARVYVKDGKGNFSVNKRQLEEYFPTETLRTIVLQPMTVCEQIDKLDIFIRVNGGGITGQAEAIRLGIARALVKKDEEAKPILKKEGFLRRDPRMVERKKYGRKKARKKFQFSKR